MYQYLVLGQPLDLSFVMTSKRNMEAWKELWELMDISTAQIQEWTPVPFSQVCNPVYVTVSAFLELNLISSILIVPWQFVVSEAQDKVNEWLQRANSVAKAISASDEVLQETLQVFEMFSQQFLLIAKLSSPTMKHKHWANIFEGKTKIFHTIMVRNNFYRP